MGREEIRELVQVSANIQRLRDLILPVQLENPQLDPSPRPLSIHGETRIWGQCSKCPNFNYVLPEEFREHPKSEWHLFNLRRPPGSGITFEEWGALYSDSVSSGSSSEWSSIPSPEPVAREKMIVDGVPFTRLEASTVAVPSVIEDPMVFVRAPYVSVLLLRSGRFAGAVWDPTGGVIAHTSFKRYTVRRNNGGSQSKNDRSRNSPAQSVGAQIRRAQEKKLSEEVMEMIQSTWSRYFDDKNTVVFAYASKSLVDDLYVGPLNKQNPM